MRADFGDPHVIWDQTKNYWFETTFFTLAAIIGGIGVGLKAPFPVFALALPIVLAAVLLALIALFDFRACSKMVMAERLAAIVLLTFVGVPLVLTYLPYRFEAVEGFAGFLFFVAMMLTLFLGGIVVPRWGSGYVGIAFWLVLFSVVALIAQSSRMFRE
jgi:hypothetical protein